MSVDMTKYNALPDNIRSPPFMQLDENNNPTTIVGYETLRALGVIPPKPTKSAASAKASKASGSANASGGRRKSRKSRKSKKILRIAFVSIAMRMILVLLDEKVRGGGHSHYGLYTIHEHENR